MRRVCPKCQGLFEGQFLCPKCCIQLQELTGRTTVRAGTDGQEEFHSVGMVTRFVAGFLLAQGSYYGLRLVVCGAFRLIGDTDFAVLTPGLMLMSILGGAMLAGAGNPRGMAAGAGIGLFHALALIGAEFTLSKAPFTPLLYGGWLVIIALGAVCGRFGRYVWPPLSDLHDPTPKPAAAPVEKSKRPSEPIAWLRVLSGAILTVGCTVWAGRIREYIIGTSGGLFTADSRLQIQFVTWIIAALAIIIGGVLAGASTRSGLKHGLLMGLLASLAIFLIHAQVVREAPPAEEFFALVVGLRSDSAHTPARIALFVLTHSLALGTFGGWFGSALLPRTVAMPKRLDRGAI